MKEKIEAKKRLKEVLLQLKDAWERCNEAFSDAYIGDVNDYILGSKEEENEYPFHKSFDDMPVSEWIYGAIERINNQKHEKERRNTAFHGKPTEQKEVEYAAFAWNLSKNSYEQIGRPVSSELLCRSRYMETAMQESFKKTHNPNMVIFKKRWVTLSCGNWDDL